MEMSNHLPSDEITWQITLMQIYHVAIALTTWAQSLTIIKAITA